TMPAALRAAGPWSDDQKREAFGSALPLLGAYRASLADPPDQKALFELLRARLSVRTREAIWDEQRVGGSGQLAFYFAQDPETARVELSVIFGRLSKGFQRLAAMEPAAR